MASICIFGDSITHGYADTKGGWAERIRRELEDEDTDVYVLGIPGETTTELLERLESEARVREAEQIVIAIGINDTQRIGDQEPRTPIEAFGKNIEALIGKARGICPKVGFVGLTRVDETRTAPIPWNPTKYYRNKAIREYDAVIREKCREKEMPYVALFDLLSNAELEDGLHPNSAGHEKMAGKIKEELFNQKAISDLEKNFSESRKMTGKKK